MAGLSDDDLGYLVNFFIPRRDMVSSQSRSMRERPKDRRWYTHESPYSFQRLKALLVRHLLGDLVPGVQPLWVASRAREWTKQIVIEVDNHNNIDEQFEANCRAVEARLETMDVDLNDMWISPSPGKGRYYRIFLSRSIPTANIPKLLELAGIPLASGRIEAFPRENMAIRLPFGWVPGVPHDLSVVHRWLHAARTHSLKRHHPRWLRRCAAERAWSRSQSPVRRTRAQSHLTRTAATALRPAEGMALPKRLGRSESWETDLQRYDAVLDRPQSPQDVEWLLQVGILEKGTRWKVLGHLAWHFVHVKRLAEDDAVEAILSWLYDPRHKSRAVQQALERADRSLLQPAVRGHVAAQVRHRERSRERSREQVLHTHATHAEATFPLSDLGALKPYLACEPLDEKAKRKAAVFLLQVLAFTRRYGEVTDGYLEAYISTHGVLRTIPGFSNSKAIAVIKSWAERVGFLTLTEAKRQSLNKSGTPCRYRVSVPPETSGEVVSLEEAITYLSGETTRTIGDTHAPAQVIVQETGPVSEGPAGGGLGEGDITRSSPPASQAVHDAVDHGELTLPPFVIEPGVPFSACAIMPLPFPRDERSLRARRKALFRRLQAEILRTY